MPRKRSQKTRTKARKKKQKAGKLKRRKVAIIAHGHPSGMSMALLAAYVMRIGRNEES